MPMDFSMLEPMRVEHATVRISVTHAFRGDLEISLRSPSGTISVLAAKELLDDGSNYNQWTFSSVRHWGESSKGLWTVNIKDLDSGVTGVFTNAVVTLHGQAAPVAQLLSQSTQPQFLAEGESLTLQAQSSGYGHVMHVWQRDGTTVSSSPDEIFQVDSVTVANGGSYLVTARNLTGDSPGVPVAVGVVRQQATSQSVNEGNNLILQAGASGPGLSYEWFKEGELLSSGTRVMGAEASTLTVLNSTIADSGNYTCRVRMTGSLRVIETLPCLVTVQQRPVIDSPGITNAVLSGLVDYTITATNGATQFIASGMPPGVTFNAATRRLSGRVTRAGLYTLVLRATNSAGTSAPEIILWTVEDFPLAARGVWNGLVGRETNLNGNLGGRLSITVANAGTYTGKLTLGAKTYSWTGRIDAKAGGADAVTPFVIVRPRPLPALTGSFTLNLSEGTLTGHVADQLFTAPLTACRNPWSATNKASSYAFPHTAVLEPVSSSSALPQGRGHTTLAVTTAGTATWAGKLADGTAITGSTTLGPMGQVSLHLMLYTNTGSLQGLSTLSAVTNNHDGVLSWYKAAQPSKSVTRSYKGGFPEHELTLTGAKYVKPAVGATVLGLAPPPANAVLRFTGAPLTTELLQLLEISTRNVVKLPTLLAQNPQQVRLTLVPTTGAMSGSFTFKDPDPLDVTPPIAILTRTATFSGVLVTRAGFNQGGGFFNLAELPDAPGEKITTTPILSGRVQLSAP